MHVPLFEATDKIFSHAVQGRMSCSTSLGGIFFGIWHGCIRFHSFNVESTSLLLIYSYKFFVFRHDSEIK